MRSASRSLIRFALCAVALAMPIATRAQPFGPSGLPALLECKADMATYMAFRRWISHGGAEVAQAGFAWHKGGPYQAEYTLARPITVFGLQSRVLGLTDNGVLAEVTGITLQRLSQRAGADPLFDSGRTYVANRVVHANEAARANPGQIMVAPSSVDQLLGITPTQPTADVQEIVQVVTNEGQPGKAMVGCNYISSAESPNLPFPVK